MNKAQRIQNLLMGVGMLLVCGVILISPEFGYRLAALIIVFSLIYFGLRLLIYYHTMARHMVGGKAMLFLSILILDFGVFVFTIVDTPMLFLLIYLLLFHGFSGAISILRAMEVRRFSSGSWVLNLGAGILNLGIALGAVVCAVVLRSITALAYLYFAGLLYSALIRIASAFRRTEIVYIQ
jgi:uncharacterized membrane protein HdeD (DUF308 family)